MYCLTRYEMKFGDEIIPARTRAEIINKVTTDTVDAPGVHLRLAISNNEIDKMDIKNENVIRKYYDNVNDSALCGVIINTNTQAVYMDAGAEIYYYSGVYDWQLERIFGKDNVPNGLIIGKHRFNGKDAKLQDVVNYLEEEFSEWVRSNCEFYTYTEEDIENGDCFGDAEPGDSILSDKGAEQFESKKIEYQNKLEKIGFTYDFKGGLIWE